MERARQNQKCVFRNPQCSEAVHIARQLQPLALFGNFAYLPCDPVGEGQHKLQLCSSKNFSALAAGDLVFIRSSRFYKGFGNVVLPLYGSMNMVKSITLAGTVELEYPVVDAVPDPYIARAETSILDIFKQRTLYCCYKARIDGISLESVSGNALERGGFLGCDFKFSRITGLTGIFTNAGCFSRIRVDAILCDRKIIDLAGCSVGSHLDVTMARYSKTHRTADEVLIALNENALQNKLSIHSVYADGFDYRSQGLIQLGACAGNRIDIRELSVSRAAGSAVVFINVARLGPGETQSVTMDNVARIDHVKGGDAMERFGFFVDAGGKESIKHPGDKTNQG